MLANNLFRIFKVADIVFINYYNKHIRQWRKDNKKKTSPKPKDGIYPYF